MTELLLIRVDFVPPCDSNRISHKSHAFLCVMETATQMEHDVTLYWTNHVIATLETATGIPIKIQWQLIDSQDCMHHTRWQALTCDGHFPLANKIL